MRGLASFGVGASALVLLVGARARASIVYQDIADIHLARSGIFTDVSAYLDIDGDGANDFQLRLFWRQADTVASTSAFSLGALPGLAYLSTSFRNGAERLNAGDLIAEMFPPPPPPPPSYNRSWAAQGVLASSVEGSGNGWWATAPGNGYMGVRVAAPGGALYGWVYMHADSASLDVFSFAYETEVNTPIAAGAVPGPGRGRCWPSSALLDCAGLGGPRGGLAVRGDGVFGRWLGWTRGLRGPPLRGSDGARTAFPGLRSTLASPWTISGRPLGWWFVAGGSWVVRCLGLGAQAWGAPGAVWALCLSRQVV